MRKFFEDYKVLLRSIPAPHRHDFHRERHPHEPHRQIRNF